MKLKLSEAEASLLRMLVWLQQLVACSLLSSLLSEYSNGMRTSRVGLTWEQHCSCKMAFEVCHWMVVKLFSNLVSIASNGQVIDLVLVESPFRWWNQQPAHSPVVHRSSTHFNMSTSLLSDSPSGTSAANDSVSSLSPTLLHIGEELLGYHSNNNLV